MITYPVNPLEFLLAGVVVGTAIVGYRQADIFIVYVMDKLQYLNPSAYKRQISRTVEKYKSGELSWVPI